MNCHDISLLLSSLDPTVLWVAEFLRLINEEGVSLSSENPGTMNAKMVLADSRIHRHTTMSSGIETWGFNELIATLERLDPNKQILVAGVIGLVKRGVLYYSVDGEVFGGVVVTRRLPSVGPG